MDENHQQNDILWDEFWPVREEVKKIVKKEEEIPEDLYNRWQNLRNQLLVKYYYLVNRVADKLSKRIVEPEKDALASQGIDGLYDAIDGYGSVDKTTGKWSGIDPKKGKRTKFETYAAYRIRGAILDELRRIDWVPRLVRSRNAKLDRAIKELTQELGRPPCDEEVADKLKIDMSAYAEMLLDSASCNIQSLHVSYDSSQDESGDGRDRSYIDSVHDKSVEPPLNKLIDEELKSKLFGKGLTPLEKDIIKSYLFHNLTMKEIAESVELSESRVSQIMKQVFNTIKERVRKNPAFFGKPVLDLIEQAK